LTSPDFQGNNGDKGALFIEPVLLFAKAKKILDFLLKQREFNPIVSTSTCQIESPRL
jgi:hypothetical protein